MKSNFTILLIFAILKSTICNTGSFKQGSDSDFKFIFKVSYIHELISEGVTCFEIINYFLERANIYNPKINAIINFNPLAQREAIDLDEYYQNNSKKLKGSLHCVPVLVKDNINVKGIPTTGGVTALRNLVPNKDSEIVERLKNSGAIIIAKANMAEFAYGIKLDSELGGLCKNPYDLTKTCAGSSSGNGAGVAAGLAVISIGSDTDGSILGPSDHNNLYGLRTPVGSPKIDGVIPLFTKQDTVGPMTKYLEDNVLTYSVINNLDSIYEEYKNNYDVSALNLGYISNFLNPFYVYVGSEGSNYTYEVEEPIVNLFSDSMEILRKIGVNVVNITLNETEFDDVLSAIALMRDFDCIFSCLKGDYDNFLNENSTFGPDAPYDSFDALYDSPLLPQYWKEFTELAFNTTNSTYACVSKCENYDDNRQDLKDLFTEIYQRYSIDSLAFLTSTRVARFHNESNENELNGLTFLGGFLDYPSLNIPIGFSPSTSESPDGLPVGMFLLTPNEKLLNAFRIAKSYENSQSFVKLPHETPLLRNVKSGIEKCIINSSNIHFITKYSIFITLYALILILF